MSFKTVVAASALFLIATTAGAASSWANAQQASLAFDPEEAMQISRGALGRKLGDHRVIGSEGAEWRLSDFRGQPLVVSFVYTSCDYTCPVITEVSLAAALDVAWEALGKKSFSVLTLGFDASADTPDRMGVFARRHGKPSESWRFVSADETTIAKITEELGFTFAASPHGFDHLAQISVIDEDGIVYRQVYGEIFDPPALVEPLKQLVFGRRAEAGSLTGWINGVRLFCTIYDPSSERYRFDYSLIIAVGVGLLSLGAIAVFLLHAWMQTRRQQASDPNSMH